MHHVCIYMLYICMWIYIYIYIYDRLFAHNPNPNPNPNPTPMDRGKLWLTTWLLMRLVSALAPISGLQLQASSPTNPNPNPNPKTRQDKTNQDKIRQAKTRPKNLASRSTCYVLCTTYHYHVVASLLARSFFLSCPAWFSYSKDIYISVWMHLTLYIYSRVHGGLSCQHDVQRGFFSHTNDLVAMRHAYMPYCNVINVDSGLFFSGFFWPGPQSTLHSGLPPAPTMWTRLKVRHRVRRASLGRRVSIPLAYKFWKRPGVERDTGV